RPNKTREMEGRRSGERESADPPALPDLHDCVLLDHDRPYSPVGLMASMITIGANNVKYESSGTRALPKLSMRPTAMLPTSAPFKLPMPPTMTTTNASGSRSRSM